MVCGRAWVRWVVLAGLAMGWGAGRGQTLARKNWEGSGLTVQAWWARGLFCSGGLDLKRVAGEMDLLERMGCDAVEVNPGSGYRAVTEMDGMMEGAGRRKMRVVVDLEGEDVAGRMRFWGARGAAGFAVAGAGGLRQAEGGRLLIAEDGQLRVRRIPDGDAARVRGWLSGMTRQGVLVEDGGTRLGYARAAMELLSGGAARISVNAVLPLVSASALEFSAEDLLLWVPQEKPVWEGLVEWVRKLSELRRGNASLRTGKAVFLDFDALGAVGWVVPGRDGRSGVLVVCNVGGMAVRVGVAGALRGAGVGGTNLKMVVRSDEVVGSGDSLEGIGLGVDGVFVGEVR